MLKIKTNFYGLGVALGIISFGAFAAAPVMAKNKASDKDFKGNAENLKKWSGHVEVEVKKGNHRDIGETEFFIPIAQSDDDLLFLDIRGMLDNKGGEEGNFGVGYRTLLDTPIWGQKWILGGYGFLDIRDTDANNKFYQLTVGAEMLSEAWDFRTNVYIPEASEPQIKGSANVSGVVAGTQLRLVGTGNLRERALPGVDVEVGHKLPVFEDKIDAVRVYGGAFHFDASGYDNVTGPRGRLELSWDDLPYFGKGSRFTLGGELQHDGVRDTNVFGSARLRIPFQTFNNNLPATQTLTPLEKRMTTRIVRDVDIVTGQDNDAERIDEVASVTINGTTTSNVVLVDATDNVPNDVNAAGAGATIIIDGSQGDINLAAAISPLVGQNISGGGITIRGNSSGLTTVFAERPTINGPVNTNAFLVNSGQLNVTLQNFDLNIMGNNANGIVDVLTNVTIDNVSIQGDGSTNSTGIFLVLSDEARLSNVRINGTETGLHMFRTIDTTVSDTTISNTVDDGVFVDRFCIGAACTANTNTVLNNVDVINAGAASFHLSPDVVNVTGTGNTSTNPTGAHCQNDDAGNTGALEINGAVLCP